MAICLSILPVSATNITQQAPDTPTYGLWKGSAVYTAVGANITNYYQLSNNDTMSAMYSTFDIYDYPVPISYTFSNALGNKLLIQVKYDESESTVWLESVITKRWLRNITVSLDGVFLDIAKNENMIANFMQNNDGSGAKEISDYTEMSETDYWWQVNIAKKPYLSYTFLTSMEADKIIIDNKYEVAFSQDYYFDRVTISQGRDLYNPYNPVQWTGIQIGYLKTTDFKSIMQANNDYEALNPLFKLLFSVFRTILGVFKWFSAGEMTNADFDAYMNYIMSPLKILNFMINGAVSFLAFVWAIGITLFILISHLIMLILAFVREDGEMVAGLKTFSEWVVGFWRHLFINPAVWLYNAIVKLVRG